MLEEIIRQGKSYVLASTKQPVKVIDISQEFYIQLQPGENERERIEEQLRTHGFSLRKAYQILRRGPRNEVGIREIRYRAVNFTIK